ncbi:hypothetical protein N657DRAFT_117274 [Parathielavia appendiculata]|uniref:Uncharacterized protein n=1 Tax=Parathielavia appendiculata TaxID=2587402 RepID=A0AAN6TWY8_9PEZI|nr:hypothetical protein N657DRAFT_117274 [Parathielavia appendiculata]
MSKTRTNQISRKRPRGSGWSWEWNGWSWEWNGWSYLITLTQIACIDFAVRWHLHAYRESPEVTDCSGPIDFSFKWLTPRLQAAVLRRCSGYQIDQTMKVRSSHTLLAQNRHSNTMSLVEKSMLAPRIIPAFQVQLLATVTARPRSGRRKRNSITFMLNQHQNDPSFRQERLITRMSQWGHERAR